MYIAKSLCHFFAELLKPKVRIVVVHWASVPLDEQAVKVLPLVAQTSVLGSLLRYFEKFSKWENAWEDYVDLCDEERNQVLAAAYKQYMLNRVTEAVKFSLEAYREYNKPWE